MEEFGVIDAGELEKNREAYALLSQAIDFPTAALLSEHFREEVLQEYPESAEKEVFLSLLDELGEFTLQDLQEHHTSLFELNKQMTLYTTYYRFEDSKERGTVLAKLKMLYEMFGASLEQAELTDYLPAMLEFLAIGEWDKDTRINDLSLLFSVMEDGTYELLQRAKEHKEDVYLRLIRLIRSELRKCVKVEVTE